MAEAPAAPSKGMTIAFRVVAGLFGALNIVAIVLFTIPVFTDDTEKVHSFHNLGSFPALVFLLGFSSVVLAIRPTDVVALRIAWAATIGSVIAGIVGQDFVTGSYFIAPIVLIVLTILAPSRGQLIRLGSPNFAMLMLAVIAAIPTIVYVWDNARIMLQGDPMTDVTGHWKYHHWSGIAGSALSLVLCAAVVSFRTEGDRMWTWIVGLSVMLFGVVGITYADDRLYPSSIGSLWGVLALFVGLAYLVVAEVSTRAQVHDTL
jgi:hypothetical protein